MTFKEDQHIELKENPKSGTIVNEIVAFLPVMEQYMSVLKIMELLPELIKPMMLY